MGYGIMEKKIVEIMTEILKLDSHTLMERFEDKKAWDSMQRVEILFALEDELEIEFSEEELAELITPQELYQVALEKVG